MAKQEMGTGQKLLDKSCIKSFGLCSHGAGGSPGVVDVKDGRVVRIRPLHYDASYRPEELGFWTMKARGKVLEAPKKCLLPPFGFVYKKRLYSPNRILYPLKRIDWNPDGDRNPQNRGKSKFVRISWDEALDIIVGEIKRVHQKYGPYGVFLQGDGHGETKVVHGTHGCNTRLMELLGGFTAQVRNPDSWEGWYWGAKHAWGMDEWVGLMWPQTNTYQDVAENTEMLLCWGCDPETTPGGFGQQVPSLFCYWFSELGIKTVYICPDLNYGAAVHADKWIPVLPDTDAAMQLAIAYLWLTEGTYDKQYVATHTFGFEKFADYVLGKEDGVPKTPAWASPKCGVPEWTIKALAREFAARITSIAHVCGGSYIRAAYATEPARMEVMLLAMQGVGKPGVNQITMNSYGMPRGQMSPNLRKAFRGGEGGLTEQIIPKTLLPEAILNPPISWRGTVRAFEKTEDQFTKHGYPVPGYPEIHMIWTDSPCWIACWNGGNRMIEALRSPKIDFILAQHPWMENDCLFADIILPVNTKLEEEDIGSDTMGEQCKSIFPEDQCVEPLGESKSDYEVVAMIAEKMGLLKEYTGGKSVKEWIRYGFETSGVQDRLSWEQLREKGYYPIPTDPDWQKTPAGLRGFYEDPQKNPVRTPSGKIECCSQGLAEHFPDDDERPPVPHWIEKGETHDERISGRRAKRYPLLLVSNHPRWRLHNELDDVSWLREIPGCKMKGPDGYLYEPVWINPQDAKKRGIKDGDIVNVFNERGGVLGGACLSERIIPGAVYQDHGARYDPIVVGKLDRGGSNNTICPSGVTSRNAAGEVTSGFLVEVAPVDISKLKRQYPEAFGRDYDPAAGLVMDAWMAKKS